MISHRHKFLISQATLRDYSRSWESHWGLFRWQIYPALPTPIRSALHRLFPSLILPTQIQMYDWFTYDHKIPSLTWLQGFSPDEKFF